MQANKILYLLRRALGGIRRRPWLHVVSIATLSAAFLSFAATLTAAVNLDGLLARWVGTAEITVYLDEGATPEELDELADAVGKIHGVASVEALTSAQAKDRFAREMGDYAEMASALPAAAFPASLDIHLMGAVYGNSAERRTLAARLEQVAIVSEVDIYDDWFEKLSALSTLGRLAAWGLGLLTLVVAILVVAAVVRAGVNARQREIEVLGLVGATDRYVRLPFLLEGALEALFSMIFAVIALHFITDSVQAILGDIFPLIGLPSLARLDATTVFILLLSSALAGLIGSRISVRGIARV